MKRLNEVAKKVPALIPDLKSAQALEEFKKAGEQLNQSITQLNDVIETLKKNQLDNLNSIK